MYRSRNLILLSGITLILAACAAQTTPTLAPATESAPAEIPTFTPTGPDPVPAQTPTPRPTIAPADTLTICQGAEPATLFFYDGAMLAKSHVMEAIYDGPIDARSFDYQPVILEKLPSLADGDARIEAVPVRAGDQVVNDAGEVVQLAPGERVRPYGCNRPECAVLYQEGGTLEMAQLSADFRLLDGLKWSDGRPLAAADSAYGFRVAANPGIRYPRFTPERTASYVALDERSVRWTGLPGFLDPRYRTNFFHPLPEHHIGDIPVEKLVDVAETVRSPLGWGPFSIEKWEPGVQMTLRKNPHYFRAAEGLPRFERLVIRFVGGEFENVARLVSGECDVLDLEAGTYLQAELAAILDLEAQGLVTTHFATGTVWEHADFSIGHLEYDDGYRLGADRPDFFGDARTRRAIALCLDRQKIVDQVLFGRSLVPDTYLPPDHPLFNPDVVRYPYDPLAGMTLLEEIGWSDHDGDPATPRLARGVPNVPDGTPLAFDYWTTSATQRQQVVPLLAESLAGCGIYINVEHMQAADLFADAPEGQLFSRNYDMAQFAWLTGADPPCQLFTTEEIPGDPEELDEAGRPRFPKGWQGQNNTGYSNPEYDDACRMATSLLLGQPEYREYHHLAQQIFAQDLPAVPLFMRMKMVLTHPALAGLILDPTQHSELWNIEEFDRLRE